MKMTILWVIVIGLVAGLVAIVGGFVLRIAWGIIEYRRQENRPKRTFQHSDLGILTGRDGVWGGEVRQDGRKIPFCVGGTEESPDPRQLATLQRVLADIGHWEQKATDYLRSHEPLLRQSVFTLYGLNAGTDDQPDDFTFEFLADGSDICVWRVRFRDGEPVECGFDD